MWNVNAILPDPAPEMFDATFGNDTVDKTSLVALMIVKGELEDLSECSGAVEEEVNNSLID